MQKKTECCNSLVSESLRVVNGTEGNYLILFYKNIQWVFSEITTTSFRWQRMVKRPDGTWETEAELFAVRR